jgi:hypothetical protein
MYGAPPTNATTGRIDGRRDEGLHVPGSRLSPAGQTDTLSGNDLAMGGQPDGRDVVVGPVATASMAARHPNDARPLLEATAGRQGPPQGARLTLISLAPPFQEPGYREASLEAAVEVVRATEVVRVLVI